MYYITSRSICNLSWCHVTQSASIRPERWVNLKILQRKESTTLADNVSFIGNKYFYNIILNIDWCHLVIVLYRSQQDFLFDNNTWYLVLSTKVNFPQAFFTVYIHNDSFPIKSAFLPPFRIRKRFHSDFWFIFTTDDEYVLSIYLSIAISKWLKT